MKYRLQLFELRIFEHHIGVVSCLASTRPAKVAAQLDWPATPRVDEIKTMSIKICDGVAGDDAAACRRRRRPHRRLACVGWVTPLAMTDETG